MLKFRASVHGGGGQSTGPLPITFDAALAALEILPRLFIEPDGSFVWTGKWLSGQSWQVDGNLIDRGDCLARVDLKGSCPQEQFDQLLRALGWPAIQLAFQLTLRGVLVDEITFRQLAATALGAV